LKNQGSWFFDLETYLSAYFWLITSNKNPKHLNKSINCFKQPKKSHKNLKSTWNRNILKLVSGFLDSFKMKKHLKITLPSNKNR
jgi:hypothetical protein